MQNGKVIKLPNKDYIISLEKFMNIKNDVNFKNYKIFDFRIKDQLIFELNYATSEYPILFVEINETNLIFAVTKYDENQNLNIVDKNNC